MVTARVRLHPRAAFAAALILILALLLTACASNDAADDAAALAQTAAPPHGEPRPFAMGFLAAPATLSEQGYRDLFAAAAQQGDLIMIQRAVPWTEMAPGASLSAETEATIALEMALIEQHGLDLLFAIDPWEPTNRGRLTADAPGTGFADPAVAAAYQRYIDLIVARYAPRWLALAVDVDQFAVARPNDLEAFQAAYIEGYKRVKAALPETKVFLTFQLEDLQDLLPWRGDHLPQWGLILRFASFLDLLAVSSFPSFIFPFEADIPDEYFSRLSALRKPLALTPVGYASAAGRGGVTFGTAAGQRAFVERLLAEAEASAWELVVWLAPQDPDFVVGPPYDLVSRMGLTDREGAPKPALAVWLTMAQRPRQAPPSVGGADQPPAPGGADEPPDAGGPNEPPAPGP